MEEKKTTKKKELTFDELKLAAEQWYQEKEFYKKKCNELNVALQESNIAASLKRVEFLFEVIKNSEKFDSSFVSNCAEEIQQALTPQEDIPEKKEEE